MASSAEEATAALVLSGGSMAHLRFNGKDFNLWRMKLIAQAESQGWADVIEAPIAATEEEVRALLSARQVDADDAAASAAAASGAAALAGAGASSLAGSAGDGASGAGSAPSAGSAGSSSVKKKAPTKKVLAEQQLLVKKSRKAYSLLINCFGNEQLQLVSTVQAGDAHGVWKVLLSRYDRKTTASKQALRMKLHGEKMLRSEKFDAFYARVKDLELRLKLAGCAVPEDETLHVVLQGLPSSYEVVVQTIRMKEDVTLESAAEHIRDFQERKQMAKDMEEAHYAREPEEQQREQAKNKFYGNAQRGPSRAASSSAAGAPRVLRCYLCSKTGHIQYECPQLPSTALKCSSCKRIGHTEKDCYGGRGGRGRRFGGGGGERHGGDRGVRFKEEVAASAVGAGSDSDEEFEQVKPRRGWKSGSGSSSAGKKSNQRADLEEETQWSALAVVMEEEEREAVPVRQPRTASAHAAMPEGSTSAWKNGAPAGLWVLDSGSTRHFARDRHLLPRVRKIVPVKMRAANNAVVTLDEGGDAHVATPESQRGMQLRDVVHSPHLATNLISVAKLVDAGHCVLFERDHALVLREGAVQLQGKRGAVVAKMPRHGNLWVVQHKQHGSNGCARVSDSVASAYAGLDAVPAIVVSGGAQAPAALVPTVHQSPLALLHARLAHASVGSLRNIIAHDALRGLDKMHLPGLKDKQLHTTMQCDGCEYGKAHRSAFARESTAPRADAVMGAWHCDLSGPVSVAESSLDAILRPRGRYVSLVIDEYSHKMWADVMESKADTAATLQRLHRRAVVSSGKQLKRLHSDGGGEYAEKALLKYWEQHGVTVTSTTAHTPQRNGVAERGNRTLFERARSMLHHAGLPSPFWCLAVVAAAYVNNRLSSSASGDPSKTAEELWSGVKPSATHLRVFGCDVFVHVADEDRKSKLDAKATLAIFVGYDEGKHAWRCLRLAPRALISSRDCTFREASFSAAAQLQQELMREEELEEHGAAEPDADAAGDVQPERASAAALRGRRASRAASHRLYAPWSAEEEERQLRAATRASKEEEQVQQRVGQEREVQLERDEDGQKRDAAAAAAAPVPVPVAQQDNKQRKKKAKPQAAAAAAAAPAAAGVRRSLRAGVGGVHVDYSAAMFLDADGMVIVDDAEAAALVSHTLVREPQSFGEAVGSGWPHCARWLDAMRSELKSMRDKKVWSLVPARQCRDAGRRPIGCKWVFKLKRKSDGTIERYKARLVAIGTGQRPGLEYNDTYAPVLRYKTLRALLCIAAIHDLELAQLDVQTAFLNGEMKEEVYMRLPPGLDWLDDPEYEAAAARGGGGGHSRSDDGGQVCLLHKAVYGTKQASNVWNEAIDATLRRLEFHACAADPCLYVHRCASGRVILLGLFVDDMISAYDARDRAAWLQLKARLFAAYDMKDLGQAEWVLGMHIARDRRARSLTLTQKQYVLQVLTDHGMAACNPAETPEEVGVQLRRVQEERPQSQEELRQMAALPYAALVGSLMYASISTRPDIAHATTVLTRYLQQPAQQHWQAAKRVLRYLRGSSERGITFTAHSQSAPASASALSAAVASATGQLHVSVYCDADWAGSLDDRRSTSGVLLLLNGCSPIIWQSKKQATVALSTAEAEYMAMSAAVTEARWLVQLLQEMGQQVALPVVLHTDSQAAHGIATSSGLSHARRKHIDIRHHFVRELVQSGWLRVDWVQSSKQIADVC
jgi:hypothetical protein